MRYIRKRTCFSLMIHFLLVGMTSVVSAQTSTEPDVGVRFAPPTAIVLTGGHVVVGPEREIESGSILIEHGKITAVGADLEIPPNAQVIDVEGKYLYPAFVDALAEFGAAATETKAGHWNEGVVPQRLMHQDAVYETSQLEELRKAGIAIVLAAPDAGIIKGQSAVVLTNAAPAAQTVLRPKAFQHIRLYPSRRSREFPTSPMGALALVRQVLSDAEWYARAKQAVASSPGLPTPNYNVALQELESVTRGTQPVIMDGSNELYALRADRLAREFSLQLVIRGSGREYRRLEAIQGMKRTFIIPVDFPDAPEVESQEDAANTTLQELMHWQLAPENPARLEAAHVDFVLSSDGLEDKSDFLTKLRSAVSHGLSEQAALRALTQGPAELLEIEQLAGTLTPGKLANILVTSGPLFDEETKIEETWVAGVRHDWDTAADLDLRGTWTLQTNGDQDGLVDMKLAGKAEKLTGEIGLPQAFAVHEEAKEDGDAKAEGSDADEETQDEGDQSVKLKSLAFNGYQISGTFEAGEILEQGDGAAILGLAILPTGENVELVGTIEWPDGRRVSVTGKLQPPVEKAEEDVAASDEDDAQQETDSVASEEIALEVNYPLGAYGLTSAPEQPEWLLIQGATIWTCGESGILESADMLVHQGVIEAVGENLEAPEGASIIDATGMHLSPGIIDCHSHMATDGGVNESGQAVTAEVRIGDFIDPNDITIYRQLAGGVTTSNILHGSANPIGGQNQVIKLRWGSLDEAMKMKEAPAGIKFALGENVKRSSRPESTRYPRSRMGVEQIMRDRFEAALLYRQRWSDWSAGPRGLPPRRDYELEAISEILEKTRWIHCHSYRQDEILTMLRTLDDYGITIGSLQHILEGYKVADAMAKHGAMGSSFSDWWAYKFEVYDAIPYGGALMHNQGVVVSFNSDDTELARHLNHEAAKAMKYGGVSPEEALKFVTLNPAKQLRIEEWVGSLEPGKQADFVLWNRSPLSTLSACTETWIDGRKYFDRQEDLERRQADGELRRSLIQRIISSGAKTRSGDVDDDPSYWWARYDEFCHHGHHEHDEAELRHEDEHEHDQK